MLFLLATSTERRSKKDVVMIRSVYLLVVETQTRYDRERGSHCFFEKTQTTFFPLRIRAAYRVCYIRHWIVSFVPYFLEKANTAILALIEFHLYEMFELNIFGGKFSLTHDADF